MNAMPGTWRKSDPSVRVQSGEAHQLWAEAAVPVLEKVASTYGGYITYKALERRLFDKTGVETTQRLDFWIGKVLGRVIRICAERGLPELTSLVVRSGDGMVGYGFNEVLRRQGLSEISDPHQLEWAAAGERLKCYRRYCTDLPVDAEPQLTREYDARVRRREPKIEKVRPVCTGCGMQLPATLVCDDCA